MTFYESINLEPHNLVASFPIQHLSAFGGFDVGRSMFDVPFLAFPIPLSLRGVGPMAHTASGS